MTRIIKLAETTEPGFYEVTGTGNYSTDDLTGQYIEVSQDPSDDSYKYNGILNNLYTGLFEGLVYKNPEQPAGEWEFIDGSKYYLETITDINPELAVVSSWNAPPTLAVSEASDRGAYSKSIALEDGSQLLLNFSRLDFSHPALSVSKYEPNGEQSVVLEFNLQGGDELADFVRGSNLSILCAETYGSKLLIACEVGNSVSLATLDLSDYSYRVQELDFENPSSTGLRASLVNNANGTALAMIADGSNDVQLFKFTEEQVLTSKNVFSLATDGTAQYYSGGIDLVRTDNDLFMTIAEFPGYKVNLYKVNEVSGNLSTPVQLNEQYGYGDTNSLSAIETDFGFAVLWHGDWPRTTRLATFDHDGERLSADLILPGSGENTDPSFKQQLLSYDSDSGLVLVRETSSDNSLTIFRNPSDLSENSVLSLGDGAEGSNQILDAFFLSNGNFSIRSNSKTIELDSDYLNPETQLVLGKLSIADVSKQLQAVEMDDREFISVEAPIALLSTDVVVDKVTLGFDVTYSLNGEIVKENYEHSYSPNTSDATSSQNSFNSIFYIGLPAGVRSILLRDIKVLKDDGIWVTKTQETDTHHFPEKIRNS